MHALKSLTPQRQCSHLQNVVSLLGATAVVAALCVRPALAQRAAFFKDPVTFCTRDNCANSNPMGLVTAELVDDPDDPNDNGYPDVAVVNRDGDSVSVFHNTGDWSDPGSALVRIGVFSLGVNQNPYDIKAGHMGDHLGDLPADSHLDLVITLAANKVAILYNDETGEGQFGNRDDIDLETRFPRGLVVADLDLDGRQDVAVAGYDVLGDHSYPTAELLWREEDATWEHRVIGEDEGMPAGANGLDMVAGRVVKSPGSPPPLDLVMTAGSHSYLITLLNEGDREFADPIVQDTTDVTDAPLGLGLGYFHRGLLRLGLVATDCWDSSEPIGEQADVYLWYDDRPGPPGSGFVLQDEYLLKSGEQVGKGPWGVAVGKLNGDADNDFVVAIGQDAPCSPGGGIAVFVGKGDGTFVEPPYLFCVDPGYSPKPRFVKIADMDLDGFNDVVTSNYDRHNISVLINALEAIPPGG